jgi:hypothetical protein
MSYLGTNIFDSDVVIRNGKFAVNTTISADTDYVDTGYAAASYVASGGTNYIADINGNVNVSNLYIAGQYINPTSLTGYDPFIESAKKITMDYIIKDDFRSYIYDDLEIVAGTTVTVGNNSELYVADFGTL